MGVDVRVVEWLRQKGHDARHLREEGLQRMPDGEIFTKAISENRVILTLDLDFAEIAALSRGQKTSVVLLRLRNTRAMHVIDRLAAIMKDSKDALEKGSVVVVEEHRHRIRYLPIGEEGDEG
jgi:predicted nuclease of predicted toxin-antitoxin system